MSEYIVEYGLGSKVNGDCPENVIERIIRCRDCKEFGLEEGEEPPTLEHCRKYVQFGGIREVDPNGLCAWAEPKEEA